ncbi:PAS domain-containing protein [Pallidibacillus pasinlerensis]|uniref:PAS domain-containing protein n=1 Tax=Pallidibacillus pasinlerensis TaxID=2703818 RepID=UPI00192A49A4|nr:PAS domain-containing protein [Pallidibacillus pasinlerensis]
MKLMQKIPIQLSSYLALADAVVITDKNHIIVDINEQYENITGYSRNRIVGLKAGFLKSKLTPKSTHKSLKYELQQNKPWSGVLINRKKSGELWHSSITITPVVIEGCTYYIGVFRELEQLQQGIYISEDKKWKRKGNC